MSASKTTPWGRARVSNAKKGASSSGVAGALIGETRKPAPRNFALENKRALKEKAAAVKVAAALEAQRAAAPAYKLAQFANVQSKVAPMMKRPKAMDGSSSLLDTVDFDMAAEARAMADLRLESQDPSPSIVGRDQENFPPTHAVVETADDGSEYYVMNLRKPVKVAPVSSSPVASQPSPAVSRTSVPTKKPARVSAVSNTAARARLPRVPRAADAAPLPVREQKNFLAANRAKAVTASPASKPVRASMTKKPGLGKVPDYLVARKAEEARRNAMMQAAAKQATAPDGTPIPDGMMLMDEEERIETVSTLKAKREELDMALRAMPLVKDTLGQRKKESDLIAKMAEIDDALTIFSRSYVLVVKD